MSTVKEKNKIGLRKINRVSRLSKVEYKKIIKGFDTYLENSSAFYISKNLSEIIERCATNVGVELNDILIVYFQTEFLVKYINKNMQEARAFMK